jgi:dephospho-CoA kinase
VLRVGLTGGLGSGKSTVAGYLRTLGAQVIESDALGRALMEPGQLVFSSIVEHFGPEIVGPDGQLNRARLAELAFGGGRINELNAIVHPAVIRAQQQWMEEIFRQDRAALAVIESALIFEVERDARARGEKETVLADWRRRIDRVVLVTAPDPVKVARYAARVRLDGISHEVAEADARRRLKYQIPDAEKAAHADYVLENKGDREALHVQVVDLWERLIEENNKILEDESLK